MRKEIDRVLGNSLRCILPSYWWKRLLGKMADKIESAEESAAAASRIAMLAGLEASDKQDKLTSGSNIKTINGQSILGSGNITVSTDRMEKYKTKEELDAVGITDGGEIAAVVDDVLVEKSFTECYQPTRSEIEANPYNAKFTKVDGLTLNPDFNPNLISSNYGELSVMLYSDGKSKGYHKGYPSHLEIRCDYIRRIICWEYDDISGSGHTLYDSSDFNASNIDRVNNILREGDFRFSYFVVTYRKNVSDTGYTYYYSYQSNFPSDATAMIDNVVKMLFADTQNADIYVRSAEWVKLLKEGDVTGGADIIIDSELSDTSENPVQNKVVTSAIESMALELGEMVGDINTSKADNTRVDLISERLDDIDGEMKDFATESQLNNKQDVITDLDTIRQGAAKGATALQSIPSEYVTESELTSKGYATTSQVNAKQDSITDLGEIRRGAGLGATALQSVPAEYITESELSAKKYATTSQLAAKQDTISDLSTIRSNASLGATAIQKVKTINGESITGDGNVEIFTKAMHDELVENMLDNEEVYAAAVNDLNTRLVETNATIATEVSTRESLSNDVQSLTDRITSNEEVTATSYNELNDRIEANYQHGKETYATNTSLAEEVAAITTTIVENEEVVAATLNDLLARIDALTTRIEILENA
jgi:hypothetical protein